MLHASFAPYIKQQRAFSVGIKWLFACAGCYWILIYGLQLMQSIDHETLKNLRGGQTMIYFVLLTLWGMEYMRETKRLKRLIVVADELGCRVQDIMASQVPSPGALFTILRPLGPGAAAYAVAAVNVVGLALAGYLIGMRYIAAFSAI